MVQFFMILSILLQWHSRQLDFVMAYLQAPTEMPLYMRLPQGYKRNGMTRKTQALKLIIKDLHLQSGSNLKKTPAVTTKLLHKDASGPEMSPDFHYRSIIGKLNFLEKSTRLDISISVHQCARFSECPKQIHAEAVKRIGCYLLATRNKGLIICPNQQWHFDSWANADFAGN